MFDGDLRGEGVVARAEARAAVEEAGARSVVVPDYRVTTGPSGEFVAVPRGGLSAATVLEVALIAGDCRRRFLWGMAVADGVDPFGDVRHSRWVGWWPDAEQQRMFPCPVCGMISQDGNDVANRYCGACHRFVDDPVPGSPVGDVRGEVTGDGRLVNTVTDVFEVAGLEPAEWRTAEFGLRPHRLEVPERLADVFLVAGFEPVRNPLAASPAEDVL
jgi:hypothetical protein